MPLPAQSLPLLFLKVGQLGLTPTRLRQFEKTYRACADIHFNIDGGAVVFSLKPIPDSEIAASGLENLVNIRRRHGVDVHPDLVEAAQQDIRKRSANLVARKLTRKVTGSTFGWADDQFDSQYLYPVKIAGKTLRASIGTAAADFWVYSSLQPKDQLKGHNYYDVNPAHLKVGSNYSIGYNGATADSEGLVYTEESKW